MPYVTSIERRALEKGEARGEIKKSREAILEVLEIRFNSVPEIIINQVNQIEDLDILKNLLRQAVITASPENFSTFLAELN
jgi:putative heme iron utilization protein